MSSAAAALRRAVKEAPKAARGFRTTTAPKAEGHGHHGTGVGVVFLLHLSLCLLAVKKFTEPAVAALSSCRIPLMCICTQLRGSPPLLVVSPCVSNFSQQVAATSRTLLNLASERYPRHHHHLCVSMLPLFQPGNSGNYPHLCVGVQHYDDYIHAEHMYR